MIELPCWPPACEADSTVQLPDNASAKPSFDSGYSKRFFHWPLVHAID